MFDFFSLPRELREYIYDALPTHSLPSPITPITPPPPLRPGQETPAYYGLVTTASPLPTTLPFLLINRQFHAEYRDRTLERSAVVLRDHMCDPTTDGAGSAWKVEAWAARLRNLVVEVTVADPGRVDGEGRWVELGWWREWVEGVVGQMVGLRRGVVNVHVMVGEGGEVELEDLMRGVGLDGGREGKGVPAGVNEVCVFEWRLGDGLGRAEGWDYSTPGPMLMKWIRGKGVVSYLPVQG